VFKDALTSLIAHLVKNLPAMQETPVQFLGQEDPLEKERLQFSTLKTINLTEVENQRGLL